MTRLDARALIMGGLTHCRTQFTVVIGVSAHPLNRLSNPTNSVQRSDEGADPKGKGYDFGQLLTSFFQRHLFQHRQYFCCGVIGLRQVGPGGAINPDDYAISNSSDSCWLSQLCSLLCTPKQQLLRNLYRLLCTRTRGVICSQVTNSYGTVCPVSSRLMTAVFIRLFYTNSCLLSTDCILRTSAP